MFCFVWFGFLLKSDTYISNHGSSSSLYYRCITAILTLPDSVLYNLASLNCGILSDELDPLILSTSLSIQSLYPALEDIHPIFSRESVFVTRSEPLIEALFRVPIELEIFFIEYVDIIVTEESFVWTEIIGAISGFILFILAGIAIYFYRKYRKYKLFRKEKTIEISKPLILAVAVGDYDECDDLPVEKDIFNLKVLFDLLNYTMYPILGTREYPKTEWKKDELIAFLEEKAKYFNDNIDFYDSLIVTLTGHGIRRHIITSDGDTIKKSAIANIFSAKYPAVRDKPRIFIFDSCDGALARDGLRYESSDEEEEEEDVLEH